LTAFYTPGKLQPFSDSNNKDSILPWWLHFCTTPPPIVSQNLEAFAATQE
jgi:hypothetical protein